MNPEVYYDDDASLDCLVNRRIAVFGYGSQGEAHALNLRDQGLSVEVALPPDSRSRERARQAGFRVSDPETAARHANVLALLIPDECQQAVFESSILPVLRPGQTLLYAHGFAVHFGLVKPPAGVDVVLVAPKSPGPLVRREFERGGGVPALIAVHQDPGGAARSTALAYARALGCTRAGVLETTFREETETDLFGEQAVLCGGVSALIHAGFETLVEAGYSPAMAYFECLHEMKLIVDLLYEGGFTRMHDAVSNTAELGEYLSGPRVVDPDVKRRMCEVLADIQSGAFARQWRQFFAGGGDALAELRQRKNAHPLEAIGSRLRQSMKFPGMPAATIIAESVA